MYKDVLQSIQGIGIYPVISFVIFGSFFIGMSIYVAKMKKSQINKLKDLPFNAKES